jgi:hypothetical protein
VVPPSLSASGNVEVGEVDEAATNPCSKRYVNPKCGRRGFMKEAREGKGGGGEDKGRPIRADTKISAYQRACKVPASAC